MIEIAFTESACGALKMAQSFGKGRYRGSCIGVFINHVDGSEPTQEEIEAQQRKIEQEQQHRWEMAIPLGGKSSDVLGFSLGLSFGDIKDPLCIQTRLEAFKILFSFWNLDIERDMRNMLALIPEELNNVISRVAAGEDVRVWYSDVPNELCGFYWLMDQFRGLPKGHGTIYAIKQPQFAEVENEIRPLSGWGAVAPGEFYRFTSLAAVVSDFMVRYYSDKWRQLQEENSYIRACINGGLSTAPDNLYDYYICREIELQPSVFGEAHVVGRVLGKYLPGISDGLIHHRIDKMVCEGSLLAETVADSDEPGYWRTLRKVY